MTIRPEASRYWYPIYLKDEVGDGQCFQVNIVDNGGGLKYFWIGVGIANLQPKSEYTSPDGNHMKI